MHKKLKNEIEYHEKILKILHSIEKDIDYIEGLQEELGNEFILSFTPSVPFTTMEYPIYVSVKAKTSSEIRDLIQRLRRDGYKRSDPSVREGGLMKIHHAPFRIDISLGWTECELVVVGYDRIPRFKTFCGKDLENWKRLNQQ